MDNQSKILVEQLSIVVRKGGNSRPNLQFLTCMNGWVRALKLKKIRKILTEEQCEVVHFNFLFNDVEVLGHSNIDICI